MPIRTVHLIDTTLDDSPTSITASHRFGGAAPKRATLLVQIVKTNSPTNVIISVDVSPDEGSTLIDYDKLIDHNGVDGPVASVTYTATLDDIISLSPEDVMDYIQVSAIATGTTSSATFAVDVWLVYDF